MSWFGPRVVFQLRHRRAYAKTHIFYDNDDKYDDDGNDGDDEMTKCR